MPNYLIAGQPIAADSTFDPEGPDAFRGVRLSSDGARLIEFYDYHPHEPSNSDVAVTLRRGDAVPLDVVGLIAVPSILGWSAPHGREVLKRRAYLGYDFTVYPYLYRPVNQIPYVLRWRQHVGQIVHDFYTTYAADAFILENNLSGLSPADVSLTSDQEHSFEIITNQIRKLVGITWGRIDGYAVIRPEGSDTWKAQTATLQDLVHKLCQTCRGEGWKIDLIVDRASGRWGNYGADRARVYYPTRNVEGRWEAGDRLQHTTEERDAHLRHWRNARRYHRNANGDEGDAYLDAPLPIV